MADVVHWQCIAFGRVQGVNYRARVFSAARLHGLVGSVRNLSDGTVFIDVQGPRGDVSAFLQDVSGTQGLSDATSVQRVAELPVTSCSIGFDILRD